MNSNDLTSNSQLLKSLSNLRIGIGHDTHRIQPGGPLRIGGIDVPFEFELVGHSDADVLLHAVTDAILGAAGLGDIGELFPNTDDVNKDRDSIQMLEMAHQKVKDAGFSIINLDCVVFAQQPKLSPHKPDICQRIATALSIDLNQVGMKAKTGEHVGPVGRGEAMQAECVALLVKLNAEGQR